MFIDYVPLMLINMAAGLFLLACYIYKGFDRIDPKRWITGFIMVGVIALISGCHMSWTWPLPGGYNVAFGEMSMLLGILFLGASLSLAKGWHLFSVGVYAFFSGLAAIVVGARIINLGLTKEPLLSGIGFILSGVSAISVVPVFYLRRNRLFRLLVSAFLITAALIWARTGYIAYWGHLSNLSKWVPQTMR